MTWRLASQSEGPARQDGINHVAPWPSHSVLPPTTTGRTGQPCQDVCVLGERHGALNTGGRGTGATSESPNPSPSPPPSSFMTDLGGRDIPLHSTDVETEARAGPLSCPGTPVALCPRWAAWPPKGVQSRGGDAWPRHLTSQCFRIYEIRSITAQTSWEGRKDEIR